MAPSNNNCLIGKKIVINQAGVFGTITAVGEKGGYLICDEVIKRFRPADTSFRVDDLDAEGRKELHEHFAGRKTIPQCFKLVAVRIGEQGEMIELEDPTVKFESKLIGSGTCIVCGGKGGGGKEPEGEEDAGETGGERQGEDDDAAEEPESEDEEQNDGHGADGKDAAPEGEEAEKEAEENAGGEKPAARGEVCGICKNNGSEQCRLCTGPDAILMNLDEDEEHADKQLVERLWKEAGGDVEKYYELAEAVIKEQEDSFAEAVEAKATKFRGKLDMTATTIVLHRFKHDEDQMLAEEQAKQEVKDAFDTQRKSQKKLKKLNEQKQKLGLEEPESEEEEDEYQLQMLNTCKTGIAKHSEKLKEAEAVIAEGNERLSEGRATLVRKRKMQVLGLTAGDDVPASPEQSKAAKREYFSKMEPRCLASEY